MEQGARAAAMVTQMVVTTAIGGWIGQQLDERFLTEPWLMVSGFTLGFSMGMIALLRVLTRNNQSDDDEPSDLP
ncbi:MAG: AtpZ/AtpI family protein [Myxococcales bacterium]|nr:AtpZ/AtpI family protein [Myxococcales bacterium]